MALARSPAEARAIIAGGRMAVFLGCESGFDHEGDPDVLAAMFRLGLRTVQFATQTGFNACSDSALAPVQGGQKADHYNGLNERGRALVAEMNRLGILIDITHGTEAVHKQLIETSRAPVVASHDTLRAVAGVGLSDEVLKALAAKGGLLGIHGGAAPTRPTNPRPGRMCFMRVLSFRRSNITTRPDLDSQQGARGGGLRAAHNKSRPTRWKRADRLVGSHSEQVEPRSRSTIAPALPTRLARKGLARRGLAEYRS